MSRTLRIFGWPKLLLLTHFYPVIPFRVQKESDVLLYTVWSLVMVREPAQEVNTLTAMPDLHGALQGVTGEFSSFQAYNDKLIRSIVIQDVPNFSSITLS